MIKEKNLELKLGEDLEGNLISEDLYNVVHLSISGDSELEQEDYLNLLIKNLMKSNSPERKMLLVGKDVNDELRNTNKVEMNELQLMIDSTNRSIIERYEEMRLSNVNTIHNYNKLKGKLELNYIFIVIPKLSDLVDSEYFTDRVNNGLKNIVKFGRTVGVHLIINSDTRSFTHLDSAIRANLITSVVLRTNTGVGSLLTSGKSGAEKLEKGEALLIAEKYYMKKIKI